MGYYFFIPIVSFLGLVVGVLLSKLAVEEKISEKYFKWMKRVIVFILLISLLYYAKTNYFILFLGVVLGFLISVFAEEYIILGISLATAFLFSKETIFLTAVLIFLYGLPYGSLYKEKLTYFLIKNMAYFFIPFLILLFDFSGMNMLMVGVCSGALFNLLIRKSKEVL